MRIFRRIRIRFYELDFETRYAISFVWAGLVVLGLLLGATSENTYFLMIPVVMLFALIIGYKRMRFFTKFVIISQMLLLVSDVITNQIDIMRIIMIELLIFIVGPIFFRRARWLKHALFSFEHETKKYLYRYQ